jgi:hypothetical protein
MKVLHQKKSFIKRKPLQELPGRLKLTGYQPRKQLPAAFAPAAAREDIQVQPGIRQA